MSRMQLLPHFIFVVACAVVVTYILFVLSWGSSIYMEVDDPNNPLSYGNLYITNDVKLLSDSIVNQKDSPHAKTMKFMEWTRNNIAFGPSELQMAYPHAIIDVGVGQCGEYAIIVSSFLACQGIPTRLISIYSETNGHVIIEVYYNEDWHMYDPTYGAYWLKDSRVLSFAELQAGEAHNATLVYTNYNLFPAFITPEIYEDANPAGVIGPQHPIWWSNTIDRDWVVPAGYDRGTRHIGATYINNCQKWTITNLTPGNDYSFVIYPKSVYGALPFVLHVNETGESYQTCGEPVYINFTAHGEVELLHIWHPYTGDKHIVLGIEKYEVIAQH